MLVHKIKVALETDRKAPIIYSKGNTYCYMYANFDHINHVYHITYDSGITIWFDKFVYNHDGNRLDCIYNNKIIAFIYGDFI